MARDEYIDDTPEGEGGDGLAAGLIILTTIVLIGAIVMVQMTLGNQYGIGMFGS